MNHNEKTKLEIISVQKEIDDLKTVPIDIKALKELIKKRSLLEAKLIGDGS